MPTRAQEASRWPGGFAQFEDHYFDYSGKASFARSFTGQENEMIFGIPPQTITETVTTEEATTAPTTDNEQYLQDLKNGLVLQTPPNFGKVFFDFAPPDQQQPCQTMFVIETDDNPNDFSAVPKIYGAAWAETPDPLTLVVGQFSK